MVRTAADPPFAPDLPPDAAPLALDAATLREQHGRSIVGARVERADLGGAKLTGLRIVDALLELAPALAAALGIRLLDTDGAGA